MNEPIIPQNQDNPSTFSFISYYDVFLNDYFKELTPYECLSLSVIMAYCELKDKNCTARYKTIAASDMGLKPSKNNKARISAYIRKLVESGYVEKINFKNKNKRYATKTVITNKAENLRSSKSFRLSTRVLQLTDLNSALIFALIFEISKDCIFDWKKKDIVKKLKLDPNTVSAKIKILKEAKILTQESKVKKLQITDEFYNLILKDYTPF